MSEVIVPNFRGRAARGRPEVIAGAVAERMDSRWSSARRYDRRAVVTATEALTPTGTVRVDLEVVDGGPFDFEPGNFVGIEAFDPGLGYRRSPHCILSPPSHDGRFSLLVRVVPDGPVSQFLGALLPGDEVAFRGPSGRAMVRLGTGDERDLVLVATGVGIGPFLSLAGHLLVGGYRRRIDLFWGLRLADDLCLVDELARLEDDHPNFSFDVTLSQPSPGWPGRRGRVTDLVAEALDGLAGRRFLLSGNGAMVAELAAALAEVGVPQLDVYEEPFFDARHVPDPAVVAAIRDKFVAVGALPSPAAAGLDLFHLERPLGADRLAS
jgi:NAD(P)H-flavin reductase